MKTVDTGAIEGALEVAQGRRVFEPGQVQIVLAGAAALERRGEPFRRVEGKLLDLAERLRPPEVKRDVPPPTPELDTAIVEAEAALAGATTRLTTATEAKERAETEGNKRVWDAQQRAARQATGAGIVTIGDARQAALAATAAADAEYRLADAQWLLARGRLTSLQLVRDRERAERTTMVIGRDGRAVPLCEFAP